MTRPSSFSARSSTGESIGLRGRCQPGDYKSIRVGRNTVPGDVLARFWAKVDRSNGSFACWPWKAGCDGDGYGTFFHGLRLVARKGKSMRAARFSLALHLGRWLTPYEQACHSCDRPGCCNPAHLRAASCAENLREARDKRRAFVGAKNGRARLTEKQVARIRRELCVLGIARPWGSIMRWARKLNVSRSCIKHIVSGENWRHVTGTAVAVRP